ncbi:MAG TPA: hypothetical protein VFW68_05560, partial [Rhodocyclaceae bacterium]|nr:hypothetical protein [Rhodocyclaceae bacterium]
GLFRFHVGDITFSVQPGIGKGSFQSPISGQVAETEISRIRNLALSAEFGPWTVRYANLRSKSTIEGVTGFEIKDNFNNIGVVYDKDAWLVMAEYAWRTTNETAGLGKLDLKSAYVTTGYRIDKVMPYVTFGRFIDESDTGAMATTENTTELGVRWDLYKNIALKAQWDHITRPSGRFDTPGSPGYAGLFRRTPAGVVTTDDKPVNVFAVGLDFVF